MTICANTSLIQPSKNIFDNLPTLAPLKWSTSFIDELCLYLSTEPENVVNAIQWWYEKCKTYPDLHCMALDYLTIPGMYSWHPIPTFTHGIIQQLQLMLNDCLVMVVLFFHTHAVSYQSLWHMHYYVLAPGASWDWFEMKMLRWWLNWMILILRWD